MRFKSKSMRSVHDWLTRLDKEEAAREMRGLMRELYPICRSITGDGVRNSLEIVRRHIPLSLVEVPTGTKVFDWEIPKEWNIRDAYIKDASGKRIADFRKSNLHVLNYSIPVRKKMSFAELQPHLFTIPDHPDWIPYRTSYYKANWGFCLSHNQLQTMKDDMYEVCIDSTLEDGFLTYGEFVLKGKTEDEVLISTHICHPSLCNDNLSGNVIAVKLATILQSLPERRYTYRFLFIPATIGSITWLSRNESQTEKIQHGLIPVCLGDSGGFTYKKTRRGDAEIDKAVIQALQDSGMEFQVIDFFPFGYDERQYCSPGFDLPVGCLMRTPHGQFPEYHTSADNLDFVLDASLVDSLRICLAAVNILEHNYKVRNLLPKCEPQLGKRGLYGEIGGNYDNHTLQLALLWVLNQADGKHTLLDICNKSHMPFELIQYAADRLEEKNLLQKMA